MNIVRNIITSSLLGAFVLLVAACTAIIEENEEHTICLGTPGTSFFDRPTPKERYAAVKEKCRAATKSLSQGNHGIYIDGQLRIITDTNRCMFVEGIYHIDYVSEGARLAHLKCEARQQEATIRGQTIMLPDLDELYKDPVFPSLKQMKEIQKMYEPSDLLLYYKFPDHGWALWKNGKIVHCWGTIFSSF